MHALLIDDNPFFLHIYITNANVSALVCQCVTFFNFNPIIRKLKYHAILESVRLFEQIKNIPSRILEISNSEVFITAIAFADFLCDFLQRIFFVR